MQQLDFLTIFDLTQEPEPTPYKLHQEMIAAMREAFLMFYQDAVRIEPQLTGQQFKVKLPDGRIMTVRMEIAHSAKGQRHDRNNGTHTSSKYHRRRR